jgi:hypothetical protein
LSFDACDATEHVQLEFPEAHLVVRRVTREVRWVGPDEGSEDFDGFYAAIHDGCEEAPAETTTEVLPLIDADHDAR